MWPMLAGIGPVLGEGIAGYFIDPDGIEQAWKYENGASLEDNTIITSIGTPYELFLPDPKVAVLLDELVISSGEVMAISFIDRPNTKSFGAPTCGLSTVNRNFELSNGETLILTVGTMASRTKTLFGGPVIPDEISGSNSPINQAIEYLRD